MHGTHQPAVALLKFIVIGCVVPGNNDDIPNAGSDQQLNRFFNDG